MKNTRMGVWVDMTGRIVARDDVTNWNGDVVTTEEEHFIWKHPTFNRDTDHAIYCDRMWQADGERYYSAIRTVWPNHPHRQMFDGVTPEEINMLLNLYFGYEVKLTGVLIGHRRDNGYPYWVFGYRTPENPEQYKAYMRCVYSGCGVSHGLPEWKQKSYVDAERYVLEYANQMVQEANGNSVLSTDDDIENILHNHVAVIAQAEHTGLALTFDVFGVAEYTDKGKTRWYYRGVYLRESNKHHSRIYVFKDGECLGWRSTLERALDFVDNYQYGGVAK